MYINTAFLSLMIAGSNKQAGLFNGRPLNFFTWGAVSFGLFTGKIGDYSVAWYQQIGASMMFTMFMFTMGSQPALLIAFASKIFARAWDRRWSFRSNVTRVDTQADYEELQLGPVMDIKQKYAALLTLIFVDMTYSATMPLFNLITLLNLLLIYVSDKYMLIHFVQKPTLVDARLPKKCVDMLYWAAMIHICNGMWLWGNNSFYAPNIFTKYSTYTGLKGAIHYLYITHSWVNPINYSQRIAGTYSVFLLLLFIALAAFLAFKFVYTVLYLRLGLRYLLQWLAATDYGRECQMFSAFFRKKTAELVGNPPYFAALSLDSINARLFSNNLEPPIHAIYEKLKKKKLQEGAKGGGKDGSAASADVKPETLRRSSIPQKYNYGAEAYKKRSLEGDVELGAAKDGQKDETASQQKPSRRLVGHESYNWRTIPAYEDKLGFSSDHLNRHFAAKGRGKDYILRSKTCERPPLDDEWLDAKIAECMPRRQRVLITPSESKMVIPQKALLLDSLLGLCGGPRAFNGRRGFECLAEPDEQGVQPQNACCPGDAPLAAQEVSLANKSAKSGRKSTSTPPVVSVGASAPKTPEEAEAKPSPRQSSTKKAAAGGERDTGFDFGSVYADKDDFSMPKDRTGGTGVNPMVSEAKRLRF